MRAERWREARRSAVVWSVEAPAFTSHRGELSNSSRSLPLTQLRMSAVKPAESVAFTGAQPSRSAAWTSAWEPTLTSASQRFSAAASASSSFRSDLDGIGGRADNDIKAS